RDPAHPRHRPRRRLTHGSHGSSRGVARFGRPLVPFCPAPPPLLPSPLRRVHDLPSSARVAGAAKSCPRRDVVHSTPGSVGWVGWRAARNPWPQHPGIASVTRVAGRAETFVEANGHEVRVSHPDKIVFPEPGLTKLDLVEYYLAVADGALRGAGGRPMVLKRFVKGIDKEAFFQKRVPENHPDFIDTVTLHYRRGTSAEEAVVRDAAGLAWIVNLGCLDLNPHAVRAEDLDHPDELRVDLDPMPGVGWSQIVDVAYVAQEVLQERGLAGWPKTSGSRGLH